MEFENSQMISLTLNFMEILYDTVVDLTNSLQKVEFFLGHNSKSFEKSSFSKTKEMSLIYQKLKKLKKNYLQKNFTSPEKKPINDIINENNENSLQKNEKNEVLTDPNYHTLLNESSLYKIKENFEIDVSNRSISNKLGLKFKSNKMETPNDFNVKTRPKTKGGGSLNDFFDFEKIVPDQKQNKINNSNQPHINVRSSLDSNRLIKNYAKTSISSNVKSDCDQRFLDIISLNERKKNQEKPEELDIYLSDNLTENLNDTSQIVNKLSSREERAIIKETLKKDYKCHFHQLSDSKSILCILQYNKILEK